MSWSETCLFFHLMEDFSFPKEFFLPIEEDYYLNHHLFDNNEHIQIKRWLWNKELYYDPEPTGKSYVLKDEVGICIDITVKDVIDSEEITLLEMLYGVEKKLRVAGKVRANSDLDYHEFEMAIIGHQFITLNPEVITVDYKLALLDLGVDRLIKHFLCCDEQSNKAANKIVRIDNYQKYY